MRRMTRAYRSQRRTQGAWQTRDDIVSAAVRVHGRDVTTLESVAQEAGVSVATVRKHFPTREDLFGACTAHVVRTLAVPSLAELRAIADPDARIRRTVRAVYAFHDGLFGYAWLALRLQGESPAMASMVEQSEAFVAAAADALFAGDIGSGTTLTARVGFARALLSPLAYRALRVSGRLDLDAAADHAAEALIHVMGGSGSDRDPR